jgi:hypothetical protein
LPAKSPASICAALAKCKGSLPYRLLTQMLSCLLLWLRQSSSAAFLCPDKPLHSLLNKIRNSIFYFNGANFLLRSFQALAVQSAAILCEPAWSLRLRAVTVFVEKNKNKNVRQPFVFMPAILF